MAPDLRGFGKTRLRSGAPVGATTGEILAFLAPRVTDRSWR